MRILAYNWRDLAHPRAGGAEVYLHSVARAWVDSGHRVTILCAQVDGRAGCDVVDGVTYIRRGGRFGVYRAARAYWREICSTNSIDLVVDSVNTRPFLTPRYIAEVPIITLIHQVAKEVWNCELPFPLASVGRYLLEPWWLRTYRDLPVVTVSASSRDSLHDYGLKNVVVVPEGFSAPGLLPLAAKESAPTVVFVGRLSANKRPAAAIQAFQQVRASIPDAQMWVIGSGPEEHRLRRLAGAGVTFLGHLSDEDKSVRIRRAHVLVATSIREGWGLVVTEAAALGTPTIAYDVPGLRDSVRASGGALTTPTPAALAARIVRHFRDSRDALNPHPGGVVPWTEVAQRVLDLVPRRGLCPRPGARGD